MIDNAASSGTPVPTTPYLTPRDNVSWTTPQRLPLPPVPDSGYAGLPSSVRYRYRILAGPPVPQDAGSCCRVGFGPLPHRWIACSIYPVPGSQVPRHGLPSHGFWFTIIWFPFVGTTRVWVADRFLPHHLAPRDARHTWVGSGLPTTVP